MKGRPKTVRKIAFVPAVSGFKPYGNNVNDENHDSVFLLYEEYEALRLNDYEKHSQCESASIMGVSRPTFTRIYMRSREKIAKAFIEGRRIIVEGGKVELDGGWYICGRCKAIFSMEEGESVCALCGSNEVNRYELPAQSAAQTTTDIDSKPDDSSAKGKCRQKGLRRQNCGRRNMRRSKYNDDKEI